MRRLRSLLLVGLLLAPSASLAVQPDEILGDAALESRARHLSRELRCMVCQNQSIDDSDAPLARDLRLLVRQRLQAGDSDRQVLDFLVARYGDFVLLRPPFETHTLLLWGLGPLALIAGIVLLFVLGRRRTAPAPLALTPDEEARVQALVDKIPPRP